MTDPKPTAEEQVGAIHGTGEKCMTHQGGTVATWNCGRCWVERIEAAELAAREERDREWSAALLKSEAYSDDWVHEQMCDPEFAVGFIDEQRKQNKDDAREAAFEECARLDPYAIKCPICGADSDWGCLGSCPRFPRYRDAIRALAKGDGNG